jgi:Fe-Mn family superoxide dismutase
MKRNIVLIIAFILAAFTTQAQTSLSILQTPSGKSVFPPLPYAYNALEPSIDSLTMSIHYSKHFKAYYDNLMKAVSGTPLADKTINQIFANIADAPAVVKNNAGGFYNHDLFWEVMGSNSGGLPTGEVAEAINKSFGSFDNFKKAFDDAAKGRFGSGWAWLYVDGNKTLKIGSTPNQDNPLMPISDISGFPLLGLDVWEHAYYLKYQNKRADYIENWWNVVNWDYVGKRFSSI